MKLLILVGLFSSAYCSESYGQHEIRNEQRVAGGGNYGGFIGLTTYPAGPFLLKGKFETDINADGKNDKYYDSKNKDVNYDPMYVVNAGYEDIQKYQIYDKGSFIDTINKDEDNNLEYLGYRSTNGNCIGEYKDNDWYKNPGNNSFMYMDDEVKTRCDRLFGFTGPTANDEPVNLIRPCALNDWQCIRKYFATNSNCKPAYGPIPDPLYIDINTAFFPVVNLTVTLPNLMISGLSSAKIREFYVNKKSGNLVFALDITNMNETIPRAYFRYRRTAKESIVLADYATVNYRSLTLTAVIPNVPHLRLDLADIHPDIHDANPPYFIGPGVLNSTDPDVISASSQFNSLLPIVVREGLVFQSQLLTSIYIQRNICDFGLKLVSV